ncbi:MAG: ATP-binding cassette domain-containing protein, partial [Actinomycetota bacterium]|nr:ATP-binding cassette domain-containing protein [Actinomycetota bacterium]
MTERSARQGGLASRCAVVVVAALGAAFTAVAPAALAQKSGELTGVVALGGGGGHALAVKANGTVVGWGINNQAQLGLGHSGELVLTPTKVPGVTDATAVAAGNNHSLALKKDGTLLVWGENGDGQLGTGSPGVGRQSAARLTTVRHVKKIAANGNRTYALLRDGTVWGWGENSDGELGNGSTNSSAHPEKVKDLKNVSAIAAGGSHMLALVNGHVYAWGSNIFGQVGDGTTKRRITPVAVKGLKGKVIAIATPQLGDYSLALLSNGTVWSWGRNDEGMLGVGERTTSGCMCKPNPSRVRGVSGIKAIAAAGGAGAALDSNGRVWAWGKNSQGAVGTGKLGGFFPSPRRVKGLTRVSEVVAGGGFFLARNRDRTVEAWGINSHAELGVGKESTGSATPLFVGVKQAETSTGFKLGPLSGTTLLLILLAAGLATGALAGGNRFRRRARRRSPSALAHQTPGAMPSPYAGGGMPAPYPQAPYVQAPYAPAGMQGYPGHVPPPPFPPGVGAFPPAQGAPASEAGWREYGRRVLFLSRVDLFAGAPQDVLTQIAMTLRLLEVPGGGVVARQGDTGEQFFLVESGTLAVVSEANGNARELARLGPGDFFGEAALLGQGRRTATVQAQTDAQLWALSAGDFHSLLARQPEIATIVRRAAAQRDAAGRTGLFEIQEQDLGALTPGGRQKIGIGRSPDNEMVLTSPLVSGHHAVVEQDGNGFRIRDLDSTNGTYVNGVLVRSAELQDGDEVWVGDERFIFDSHAIRRSVQPQGIRLDATGLSKEVSGGKKLLHDVTVSILPGEFVAIVGGSGAGKTTLMDALSGVRPPTSGRVLYNGRDYYRDLAFFRNVLGYVPQDDIIHTGLPLRLTLQYAARLRLPTDTSREDIGGAVTTAMTQLELTQQADVKVAQLSGGQRKRASIGVELLTQPKIFFLDEPTSGLDPFTDSQMMSLLRRLADSGSTVVLTTHATANVMQCDKVVFLARGGHLAFVGTPQGALRYFGVNSFDGIYHQLAEEGSSEDWSNRFRSSEEHRRVQVDQLQADGSVDAEAQRQSLGESGGPGGFSRGVHQLTVLSLRAIDLIRHNPKTLPSLVMPPILFTFLAIALFQSGVFDARESSSGPLQIDFLLAFSAFIFGLLFGIQEIVKEYAVFRRERLVNLGILPYVLSKLTFLTPLLAVLLLVMVGILRVTERLPHGSLGLYGKLLLTLVLIGFIGLGLALLTSALVSTPQQATDMLSVWIMPQVLFGGALLAVPQMNVIGRVISALAPVRWAFEALGHITDLE